MGIRGQELARKSQEGLSGCNENILYPDMGLGSKSVKTQQTFYLGCMHFTISITYLKKKQTINNY